MLTELAKNLWLLLTVAIPGLFTYGAWRLLLLLQPSERLNTEALKQIDDSAIASTSIVIAIALMQQAFAIAIEAVLTRIAIIQKRRWPNYYALFCERFALAEAGRLNENATRVIGNFFLSVNISIGILLVLAYFILYDNIPTEHWLVNGIGIMLTAAWITAAFRMVNAMWVVKKCKTNT